MASATCSLEISVGGAQALSISIEAYTLPDHAGVNPYAGFIISPARANVKVKCDYGSAVFLRNDTREIPNEKVQFSGSTSPVRYYTESLVRFTGFFVDAEFHTINPTFTVEGGVLKSNVPCWGTGFFTYVTIGAVYAYNAQITTDLITGAVDTRVGTVFAAVLEVAGVSASYDIPTRTQASLDRLYVLEVSSKVLVVGKDTFEVPDGTPEFPTGNTYLNYGSPKPPLGEGWAYTKRVHELVCINKGQVGYDNPVEKWHPPCAGDKFIGLVCTIEDKIPPVSQTMPQTLYNELQAIKAALIIKWNITV